MERANSSTAPFLGCGCCASTSSSSGGSGRSQLPSTNMAATLTSARLVRPRCRLGITVLRHPSPGAGSRNAGGVGGGGIRAGGALAAASVGSGLPGEVSLASQPGARTSPLLAVLGAAGEDLREGGREWGGRRELEAPRRLILVAQRGGWPTPGPSSTPGPRLRPWCCLIVTLLGRPQLY